MDKQEEHNTSTNGRHIRLKRRGLVAAVAICLFVIVIIIVNFTIPDGRVPVTGREVDNDYNNFMAGGMLARIGGVLYYNYNVTENKSGLIQITEDGSKRVYWEGPYIIAPFRYVYRLRKYDNKLLLGTSRIKALDENTGEFVEFSPFCENENMNLNFQIGDNSMVYGSDSPEGQDMFIWQGASSVKIESIGRFYIAEKEVYYWDYDSSNGESVLHCIDLPSKTDSEIYSTTQYYDIDFFFVEKQYLIFEGTGEPDNKEYICRIGLHNPDQNEKILYRHSEKGQIYQINVYNGTVYASTDEGLKAIDLELKSVTTLCKTHAEECYILDDTWVYFVDENGTLWRITQQGQNLEKVYG